MACEAPAVKLGLGEDLQGVSVIRTLGRAFQQVKVICNERGCLSGGRGFSLLGDVQGSQQRMPLLGHGAGNPRRTELLRLLGGLHNRIYCLTVLEAGRPKSRCRQGWFLLRALREESSQASRYGLLVATLRVHMASAPCARVLQTPPDFTDVSHVGLGATLMTSF